MAVSLELKRLKDLKIVGMSSTNGNIKLDGIETSVYTHPTTHSADMIVDGTINKAYTSIEKTKLANIKEGTTKVEPSTINGNIKIDGVESSIYTQHPPNINLMDETTHRITVTKENMSDLIMLDTYYDTISSTYKISNIYIDKSMEDYDIGFTYKVDTTLINSHGQFSNVINKFFGIYKWSDYSQDYEWAGVVGNVSTKYLSFDIVGTSDYYYRIYTTGSTEGFKEVSESITNGNILIDNKETRVYDSPFVKVELDIELELPNKTHYGMNYESIPISSDGAIVCNKPSYGTDWTHTTCQISSVSTKINNDNNMYMIFINNPSGSAFDTALLNKMSLVGASKFKMYDVINKYALLCYKGDTMEYVNFDMNTQNRFFRSFIFNYKSLDDRLMGSNSDSLIVDNIITLKNYSIPYITGTVSITVPANNGDFTYLIPHTLGVKPSRYEIYTLNDGQGYKTQFPLTKASSITVATGTFTVFSSLARAGVDANNIMVNFIRQTPYLETTETYQVQYYLYK